MRRRTPQGALLGLIVVAAMLVAGCYGPTRQSRTTVKMSCSNFVGSVMSPPTTVSVGLALDAPQWADPGQVIPLDHLMVTGMPTSGVPTKLADEWATVKTTGLGTIKPDRSDAVDPAGGGFGTPQGAWFPPPASLDFGSATATVFAPVGTHATIAITRLTFETLDIQPVGTTCTPIGAAPVVASVYLGRP